MIAREPEIIKIALTRKILFLWGKKKKKNQRVKSAAVRDPLFRFRTRIPEPSSIAPPNQTPFFLFFILLFLPCTHPPDHERPIQGRGAACPSAPPVPSPAHHLPAVTARIRNHPAGAPDRWAVQPDLQGGTGRVWAHGSRRQVRAKGPAAKVRARHRKGGTVG